MLTAEDIRVVSAAAARRWGGGSAAVDDAALAAAVAAQHDTDTPYVRAATLAAALIGRRAVTTAPLQTALLVLHCSLSLDGHLLLAPQGVTAGMVRVLAAAEGAAEVARWLEDRAVPAAAG